MNMQNGEREAKLLAPEDRRDARAKAVGDSLEDRDNTDALDRALKDVRTSYDSQPEAKKITRHTPETESIRQLVAHMALNADVNEIVTVLEQLEFELHQVRYFSELFFLFLSVFFQIDNADTFSAVAGFTLIKPHLKHDDTRIRSLAAACIAAACQRLVTAYDTERNIFVLSVIHAHSTPHLTLAFYAPCWPKRAHPSKIASFSAGTCTPCPHCCAEIAPLKLFSPTMMGL
jgi:hypothetical protein